MDRTFYIEHLGCAKNRVDAQVMSAALNGRGWLEVESAADARVIIVNSCGFIEPAKLETIETTIALRRRYPEARIVLAGCLAQRYGDTLSDTMPEIDAVFGNRNLTGVGAVVDPDDSVADGFIDDPDIGSVEIGAGSAYLKISEGCDNRCTYCAIPLIRGGLSSRTPDSIVADAGRLIDRGVVEINLIAQDLASYGADVRKRGTSGPDLVSLLEQLTSLPGDSWFRLLYLHPDHIQDRLIEFAANTPRVLPYFDLPFQHASAPVLSAMGRRGTDVSYLTLIEKIRSRIPDAVIRSTLLVGFPGERRRDREVLLDFQQQARIDWLGVFVYSPEEGTPAWRLLPRGRLSRHRRRVAEQLREEIETRQQPISESRLERFVGHELEVLIEEPIDGTGFAIGRGFPHAPEVDGNVVVHGDSLIPGTRVRCRVFKRNGIDLEAQVV